MTVQWVKNGKQARINGEMSFDGVGTFVKTKAFGLNTGIAGTLHGLRVNHQQQRSERCQMGSIETHYRQTVAILFHQHQSQRI